MSKRSATATTGTGASDLRTIALFARVVESRSLTAAGRAFDMTTSSVSKRLASLEERFGVRLLERTTRRVQPTEAGSLFYERCRRILVEVTEAERVVAEMGRAPRGVLRCIASVALGEQHLPALAAAFLSLYPDVSLDLVLSDAPARDGEEPFDVAIQVGPLGDSTWVARRLTTDPSVVCVAPDYSKRRGEPRTPIELLDHDCLNLSHRPIEEEWTFSTADGTVAVPVVPRARFSHSSALREAAVAGLGVAVLPRLCASAALRRGALRPVLDACTPAELTVAVLYPAGKHRSPKVTAFVDYIAEHLPARLARDRDTARDPR